MSLNDDQLFTGDYFDGAELIKFRNELQTAILTCNELAAKYKCKVFRDSRWPATGVVITKLHRTRYIRLILNHEYLVDKKVFYEIWDHAVIKIPMIYTKTLSHSLICTIDSGNINNKTYLYQKIEACLLNKP